MSQEIADFLRRIPQSNRSPKALADLADGLDLAMLHGIVLMLHTIGIVKQDESGRIQAVSQTGKYMLESLAVYLEADLHWVDDWHTRGIYRLDERHPLQNGATLLHALESRRLSLQDHPPAIRTEKVAQVIIKRTNPQTGQAELLFQYDKNAQQFQLIGGRYADADKSILETMIREIEEELADNLHYETDYHLDLIAEQISPSPNLSPTFGALTKYDFWVYHMRDLRRSDLVLQPEDCWAVVDDILAGYVTNQAGERVPFTRGEIYLLMNEHSPAGLANLPDSFRN